MIDPDGTTPMCWFVVTWKVTTVYDSTTGQILSRTRQLVDIQRKCSSAADASFEKSRESKPLFASVPREPDTRPYCEQMWWDGVKDSISNAIVPGASFSGAALIEEMNRATEFGQWRFDRAVELGRLFKKPSKVVYPFEGASRTIGRAGTIGVLATVNWAIWSPIWSTIQAYNSETCKAWSHDMPIHLGD